MNVRASLRNVKLSLLNEINCKRHIASLSLQDPYSNVIMLKQFMLYIFVLSANKI